MKRVWIGPGGSCRTCQDKTGKSFDKHEQEGHVQLVSVQRLVGTDDDFVTLRVGRVELDVLYTSSARAVWILEGVTHHRV